MDRTYSILITGLDASEENHALTHFSELGHEVFATSDLKEAARELRKREIHLMYLRITEGDHPENKFKEVFEFRPSLPVVVVCDKTADDLILNAWRSGAADVVFPPLTAESLNESLQRCVKKFFPSGDESTSQTPARLFYLDEGGKERQVDITPPRFTLGRSSSNGLVIGQMGVSRFHAEILVQEGDYLLRDLGSKMGTFVNGVKTDQVRLKNGDRIQLGGMLAPNLSFHSGDLLQSLLTISNPQAEMGLSLHGFKEVGKLFATLRALSSISVLDDLLALVVDTAIELTGAERGFIMLKEQSEELDFRCARNNNKQSLEGSCFQTSHRVPQDVFKTGKPVVIKDLGLGDEAQSHDVTRKLGLRSICCVPIRYMTVHEFGSDSSVSSTEIIGVLYVDNSNMGTEISDTRIDALETLASEAAMAIYNARLYRDSQDKRKMDEQLAVAHEIQQALLPQPEHSLEYVLAFSQSIPCYNIGGDYFDYFDLESNRFGFAIGDVAGKGLPAALLASLTQGIFSAQSFDNAPLPEIIGKVNRNLAQRGPGNRFVTFFSGIMEPDGNCIYVNAGHNPPLLLSRNGALKELTEGGMVLGLFAEAQYESGNIKLQEGDRLVLFTDGVVEALNPSGEEFGMERLVALLQKNLRSSTSEILTQLRESVLSFSARCPQHDDITMMVLEFRGSGA
jgi:sigma-B regulation protein RsbU (phosphoserine phosphatase)